ASRLQGHADASGDDGGQIEGANFDCAVDASGLRKTDGEAATDVGFCNFAAYVRETKAAFCQIEPGGERNRQDLGRPRGSQVGAGELDVETGRRRVLGGDPNAAFRRQIEATGREL